MFKVRLARKRSLELADLHVGSSKTELQEAFYKFYTNGYTAGYSAGKKKMLNTLIPTRRG